MSVMDADVTWEGHNAHKKQINRKRNYDFGGNGALGWIHGWEMGLGCIIGRLDLLLGIATALYHPGLWDGGLTFLIRRGRKRHEGERGCMIIGSTTADSRVIDYEK